jgi:hypothetical protein
LPLPQNFTHLAVQSLVYFMHAALQTPLLKQVVEKCPVEFDMSLFEKTQHLSFDKPQWLIKTKLEYVRAQAKHRKSFKGQLQGMALLLEMCSHDEDAYQILKAQVPSELLCSNQRMR